MVRRFSLLLSALLLGCGTADEPPQEATTWSVEDPADHGLDPAALDAVRAWAFEPQRHTQGVVIVRHGVIVAEWYAEGRDAESPATSWSVAKSVTSALIGIALDEGHLEGVDQPMHTWFPDWAATEHAAITLHDVLIMGSGLAWVEDYDPSDIAASDIIQMILVEEDQLAYAASRPVAEPPGSVFNYSSGDTMLLGGVLAAATGEPVGQYARTRLFEPLGMEPVDWWQDASGNTATYCCIDTPSRDFARFGELFLRDGAWRGTRVVPADWVQTATTPASFSHYGYQWWLDLTPSGRPLYSALGHDGQYIHVIDALDMVVVRNGVYDKYPGEPVADPSLWALVPSGGMVEGRGSIAPEDWSDLEFLGLIEAAVVD